MSKKVSNKAENTTKDKGAVMRSFAHCGNKKDFETWTELEYNDGSDEPHTGGNYLLNVEFVKCLKCGEVL